MRNFAVSFREVKVMSERCKQSCKYRLVKKMIIEKTVNLDDKMITVINVRYVETPFHPLRLVYNFSGV